MRSYLLVFGASVCLSVGALFSVNGFAKTLDFKPLSMEVKPQDRYLVRGFKGKVTVIGQSSSNVMKVSLKQIQPQVGSDMKEIVDEWLFSVQRRENILEVVVKSPHSKGSWAKTLQTQQMPSFEMQIEAPPRALEMALRDGPVRIDNWSSPIKLYGQKSEVVLRNTEGELSLSVQEGSVSLQGHKGKAAIESYSAKVNVTGGEGSLSIVNFAGTTDVGSQNGAVELSGYQGAFQVSKGLGRLDFDVDRSSVKIVDRQGELRGKSGQGAVVASLIGESDVRLTTKEGNVNLTLANSGAQLNVGTEEGQVYAPSYLSVSRLPNMRLVQGRLKGKTSGSVHVRSQSGSIRVR